VTAGPQAYYVYASPCQDCREPVVPDGRGYWVHTRGWAYSCRDQYGVVLPTHAAPVVWLPTIYLSTNGRHAR